MKHDNLLIVIQHKVSEFEREIWKFSVNGIMEVALLSFHDENNDGICEFWYRGGVNYERSSPENSTILMPNEIPIHIQVEVKRIISNNIEFMGPEYNGFIS